MYGQLANAIEQLCCDQWTKLAHPVGVAGNTAAVADAAN